MWSWGSSRRRWGRRSWWGSCGSSEGEGFADRGGPSLRQRQRRVRISHAFRKDLRTCPSPRGGLMARPAKNKKSNGNGANLGFEATLWAAADKLRNNMDAAEYKHVVLGLIFLKYISDAFEEKHAALVADKKHGADPEDPDEYRAANVFWVPKEARWTHLQSKAKLPAIGKLLDDAVLAIERDNKSLKGVLRSEERRVGKEGRYSW